MDGKSEDPLSKNMATKTKVLAKALTPKAELVSTKQVCDAKPTPEVRKVTQAKVAASALASAAIAMETWSVATTTSEDLIDELHSQTERLKTGDMSNVEEMLYCQAVTLQTVFTQILQGAVSCESLKPQNMMLTLAFKAQAQCRTTLETLANIKNPRAVAFVKQANIANNQQVNNGAGQATEASARAREKTLPFEQNELITIPKVNHVETMDIRAKGGAGTGDSTLETVGVVHGPEITGG